MPKRLTQKGKSSDNIKVKMKLRTKLLIGATILTAIASTALSPKPKGSKKPERQTTSSKPPKKTIVHLKQRHISIAYSLGNSVKSVVKSQDKIYNYIVENNIKELYVEGLVPEMLIVYKIGKLEGFKYSFSVDKLEPDKPYTPEDLVKLGYRPAWSRLVAEGRVKVLPLERVDRYMKALETLADRINGDATKEDFRDTSNHRENGMLEDLVKDQNKKVYVLLGGAHDFKDNIREWNRNNPDKSYGLIEVEASR